MVRIVVILVIIAIIVYNNKSADRDSIHSKNVYSSRVVKVENIS